jgi:hypothetical protein
VGSAAGCPVLGCSETSQVMLNQDEDVPSSGSLLPGGDNICVMRIQMHTGMEMMQSHIVIMTVSLCKFAKNIECYT